MLSGIQPKTLEKTKSLKDPGQVSAPSLVVNELIHCEELDMP